MIEIKEILYRYQKGIKKRALARVLNISRNTLRNIIKVARGHGFNSNSSIEEINEISAKVMEAKNKIIVKADNRASILRNYHERINQLRELPYMTVKQIYRLLSEEGVKTSETSLRRYIKGHFAAKINSTIRIPTIAGEQGQVDFGYIGKLYDKSSDKLRKAYAFVMTLSHSRYRFVRLVFNQDSVNWIDCHIRAFEFFGGVPKTIIIDNLKSGITGVDYYDPIINRSYGELEHYYGFIVDPTKVRTPKHKGKVERSMSIVKQQLIAGYNYSDINEVNERAVKWCRYGISQEVCRSTGKAPLTVFKEEEKQALLPLPKARYERPEWNMLKVHRDQHVVIEGSFYSLPYAYVGKQVVARYDKKLVQIFYQERLIKTHSKAESKGIWVTDYKDYPKEAQTFLLADKESCLEKASFIGKFTYEFCKQVLDKPTLVSRRKTLAVLRLANKYSPQRLEAACKRALSYGNFTYKCLVRILNDNLEKINEGVKVGKILPGAYLRNPKEFSHYNQDEALWKTIH